MKQELIDELIKITDEERQILDGAIEVNKDLYQSETMDKKPGNAHDKKTQNQKVTYEIDAKKLLDAGKLITIRKHTRFVHFPAHTHNYVEIIYMCKGCTHHVINGTDVILNQGELLFLNQNSIQEIYPAGEEDIAVNFIVLPEFFDHALRMMESESNPLRSFVIECMTGANEHASYLHFKVADVLPIQNLVENLIWTLMNHQQNKRSINQVTMGLLLLQLMSNVDTVETDAKSEDQKLMMTVLSYIEEHYKDGELTTLAAELHYDFYWLSKEIKKRTGQTYTDLVQQKRLSQAEYLIKNTTMQVADVAVAVGYENVSYFHRIFQKRYNMSPRQYRVNDRTQVIQEKEKL